MLRLHSIGAQIASRRKALGLSQSALADKAGVSRATLEALENGRSGELGFSKVANILSALGLELKLQQANLQRPTLDELLEEDRDDKDLDRRRGGRPAGQAAGSRKCFCVLARDSPTARRLRYHARAASLLGRVLWPSSDLRDEPPGRRVAGMAATRLCEGDWNIR